MALASQMGRQGMRRRYMTTRRRRQTIKRWIAILAILAVGLGWYFWPDQQASDQQDHSQASAPQASARVQPVSSQSTRRSINTPPAPLAPKPVLPKSKPISQEQALAQLMGDKPYTPTPPAPAARSQDKPVATATPAPVSPRPEQVSPPDEQIRSPAQDLTVVHASPLVLPIPEPEVTPSLEDRETVAVLVEPMRQGKALIEAGNLLAGREVLNELLVEHEHDLSNDDAHAIRETLSRVNQSLVFSPAITPGDPLIETYTVQPGDLLSRVAPKFRITYQLIEYINNIDARRIRTGQQLKVVQGPFHAVVTKSEFRLDIFAPGPDNRLVYIRSFAVGLGENDSTPVGQWIVPHRGKLFNPGWTNPRTGKVFAPDDPNNPIGDYWIALEGVEDRTRGLQGYGIHGTIEPDSIGRLASMGCVRLRDDDAAMIYRFLVDGLSSVQIRP